MEDTYKDSEDEIIIEGDDEEAEEREDVAPVQYDITSYGADYTVDSLVKRLKRNDIFIPEFQRDYVWNLAEASRLIESCLLGLPIPGIFLARESNSNKLLIIDGQQRLKSLRFFYEGYFDSRAGDRVRKIFKLIKVQKRFEGLTYESLNDNDRLKLDDSIIHATIIKQESPEEDNTSIYHVFERLNTGGKKLTPQEIRTAIYYGLLNTMIDELNDYPAWRELYGPKSNRLKDKEMILRFLAVYFNQGIYTKPMAEFLNKFNKVYRNPSQSVIDECKKIFKRSCDIVLRFLGKSAFRPERSFNIAVYESIMIVVARNFGAKPVENDENINIENFRRFKKELFDDNEYIASVTRATSDEATFQLRHAVTSFHYNRVFE